MGRLTDFLDFRHYDRLYNHSFSFTIYNYYLSPFYISILFSSILLVQHFICTSASLCMS